MHYTFENRLTKGYYRWGLLGLWNKMGCRDFQNKHYSKELGTCSVCSVQAGFKNNSRCGVEIVPMPKFKNSGCEDCKFTETIPKAVHDFILVCEINMLLTPLAPIARQTFQLHFGSKNTSNFFPKKLK